MVADGSIWETPAKMCVAMRKEDTMEKVTRGTFFKQMATVAVGGGLMAQGEAWAKRGPSGGDWAFNHVGVSFTNVKKTVEYFRSTGMGVRMPWGFGPPPSETPQETPKKAPKVTKPQNITLTNGFPDPPQETSDMQSSFIRNVPCIQVGTLQIEAGGIARKGSGRSEFEKEGVSHICFNVPDIQGESSALIDKGVEVTWALIGADSLLRENYLDLREIGNIILSFRPEAGEGSKRWLEAIMANPLVSDWKFRSMGIPVRDLDRAVDYYQSLEIGAFKPEVMFDTGSMEEVKIYGKSSGAAVKARTRKMARVGQLAFEFIQPLEGEAMYKEYLDRRGDEAGVSEFAFTVRDLEKETAKLVEKGVPVILSGKPETGGAFACFDTRENGGDIVIKLIQAEIQSAYPE